MELTNSQKDILKIMILNELNYYGMKEDIYEEDREYIKELEEIMNEIEKEN